MVATLTITVTIVKKLAKIVKMEHVIRPQAIAQRGASPVAMETDVRAHVYRYVAITRAKVPAIA